MKRIIRIFFLISGVLLSACKQNIKEDAADFVFSTENVEGDEAYYSKPAVITGHIFNREVYPNTKDVSNDVVPAFLLVITKLKPVYTINIIIFVGIEPNILGYGLT